jgi:hypothetical protein
VRTHAAHVSLGKEGVAGPFRGTRCPTVWQMAQILAILLAVLTVAQTAEPGAESPFVGTWAANLAKSRLDSRSDFQRVTLQISIAADTMTMSSEIVSSSGRTQRAAETFRTDGLETPGTLNPGIRLMAKWLGTRVLASIATRNGQLYALVTYEVSADGNTLTSRSSGTADQVIVYERK